MSSPSFFAPSISSSLLAANKFATEISSAKTETRKPNSWRKSLCESVIIKPSPSCGGHCSLLFLPFISAQPRPVFFVFELLQTRSPATLALNASSNQIRQFVAHIRSRIESVVPCFLHCAQANRVFLEQVICDFS